MFHRKLTNSKKFSNKEEEEDNDKEKRNALNVDYLNLSKFVIKTKIGEGLYDKFLLLKKKKEIFMLLKSRKIRFINKKRKTR